MPRPHSPNRKERGRKKQGEYRASILATAPENSDIKLQETRSAPRFAFINLKDYLDRAGLPASLIGAGLTLTGLISVWLGFLFLFFAYAMFLRKFFPRRFGRHQLSPGWHLICVLLIVLFTGYVFRKPMASQAESKKDNPLTVAQLHDVMVDAFHDVQPDVGRSTAVEQAIEINRLIGEKDENELRNIFAFPEMMNLNIQMVRDNITARRAGRKNTKDYGHGQLLFSRNIGRYVPKGGGIVISYANDDVPAIVLPENYTKNEDLLKHYLISGTVPSELVEPLRGFLSAINDDAELLHEILNDASRNHPEYFFENDNPKSPVWAMLDGQYWRRFQQLRPKADEVSGAIRVVLEAPGHSSQ